MAAKLTVLSLVLLVVFITRSSEAQVQYVVTAPNTIRYGVAETVGISVTNAANPVTVDVYLQDNPGKKTRISEQRLVIQSGNPVLTKVTLNPESIPEAQRNDTNLHVFLVVRPTGNEFPLKEMLLPVTKYSGYVFVQTDKPLYLPNQAVQIRVFSLNEDLLPSNDKFILEVKNPQKIRVMYKELAPSADVKGIVETNFKFSSLPMFGNWSVTVHYGYENSAKSTVQFEVKEYVLPTFSVIIEPQKTILSSARNIEGLVRAQYVYGKPVKGLVNLKHEIHTPEGVVIPLGGSRNDRLEPDGTLMFQLNVEHDIKTKKNVRWFPHIEGSFFVTQAEVVEEATGNKESTVDSSSVFTTSPYMITFPRSLKDFKPGVPYQIQVDVSYASGDPVTERIMVEIHAATATQPNKAARQLARQVPRLTDTSGRIMFQFDTDTTDDQLQITVKTADEGFEPENQALGKLSVVRYQSPVPGSYVWITAPQDDLTFQVGKSFSTSVTIYPDTANIKLYYMVISRGAIVLFKELGTGGGAVVRTVQFDVKVEMSPSARLVVFYIKNNRFIADSMLLDVERRCKYNDEKPLRVEAHTPSGFFSPGKGVDLKFYGEHGSTVGVVAVDEAVYLLNSRNRLTPDTMFSELKSHDLGCGPGGGQSTETVLRNAGVVILSNAVIGDHSRKGSECGQSSKSRATRSIQETLEDKVLEYEGNEVAQQCCLMVKLMPRENMDCAQQAQVIYDYIGERDNCSQAFLDCCQTNLKIQEGALSLGRTGANKAGGMTSEKLIERFEKTALQNIRRYFPETWLFNLYQIGGKNCKSVNNDDSMCIVSASVPHSITTWKVQAVGISEKTGICVAEPLKVTVFKPMFIQLQVPYKAIRGEQIEVPATVFNYGTDPLDVSVYMYGVEGMCMGAASGEKSEIREITVPGNGAKTVSFPVMPLQVTEYTLRVVALSVDGSDAVEKKLRVVPEGVQKEVSYPIVLDPTGFYRRKKRNVANGVQETYDEKLQRQTVTLEVDPPDNHIPGTGKCVVTLVGDIIGQAVPTTLSGLEQKFIKLPTGCGEQTMLGLGPLVYTMLYLKRANKMTAEAEKSGYQFMQQGYIKQLTYRKPNGSFAVWHENYPSSTWLTAFVARVFCQADTFINVEDSVKCGAVNWLATQQRATGEFFDAYRVHHREMTGSVQGDVTMTAFVVVAMQECSNCDSAVKRNAIGKAVTYLENHFNAQERPFAVAISAYALALAKSKKAEVAVEKLKRISVFDENTYTRNWRVDGSEFGGNLPWVYQTRPSAVAVETAGYALLTVLLNDDIDYSHPIANWLNQQRSASGAFLSTQDTVVALQALAEYSAKANIPPLDMICNVTSQISGRSKRSFVLKSKDALLLHEAEMPVGGKLIITAEGKGLASMSAAISYNVEQRPEEKCKFNLSVATSEGDDFREGHRPINEFAGLGLPEVAVRNIVADEEVHKFGYEVDNNNGNVDERQPARQKPKVNSRHVLTLEMCIRYLDTKPAGMSILDVGLFTGYKPITDDLTALKRKQNTTKVNYFEINDRSVVLYLDMVPHNAPLCIKLRTVREIVVGKVQATAVKVYDYYEPDRACTKFYRPDGGSPMHQQICEGNQCVCVEGQCPKCKPLEDLINIPEVARRYKKLRDMACDMYHFVWNTTLVRTREEGSFRYLDFRVSNVLKEGIQKTDDVTGTIISFANKKACECREHRINQNYMIMGNDGFQYRTKDGEIGYKYVFDKDTVVYHSQLLRDLPNKSKEQAFQKTVNNLHTKFINEGCVS